MAILLLWLPLILRGASVITGLLGLFQAAQVQSGQYSASPINLGLIATWFSTSGIAFISSFFAQPTTWATLKKSLDVVFKWVHSKLNLDPSNATDIDERAISWLEDEIINLLQSLVSRWLDGDSKDRALAAIDQIRQSRAVARSAVATRSAKSKG
jgi:hypothetical protein